MLAASWVTAVTQDSLLSGPFAVKAAELPYTTQHAGHTPYLRAATASPQPKPGPDVEVQARYRDHLQHLLHHLYCLQLIPLHVFILNKSASTPVIVLVV